MAQTPGASGVSGPSDQGSGSAQQRPAPNHAPEDGLAVEGVTVMAPTSGLQTSIDRRSYDITKDLGTVSGSIADALRNVPSVEVDLQGGLTLRGDPSVTILVDGKPSNTFAGPGRAEALQQLPADQIERVEVITNPSAALDPSGSAGIINLITKKSRGGGLTGSTYVTAGSAGLKRVGVSFGYNTKTVSLSGSVSGNHQNAKSTVSEIRTAPDPTGASIFKSIVGTTASSLIRGPSAQLSLDYTLSPMTHLTAQGQYSEALRHVTSFNDFVDDSAGVEPDEFLSQLASRRYIARNATLSAGIRRRFPGDDHVLSVDLIGNKSTHLDRTVATAIRSVPPTDDPFETVLSAPSLRRADLRVAYSRPMSGDAVLKSGYELRRENNDYGYRVARGPAPDSLAPDPLVSNDFAFRQTINSAYTTYERPIGDLEVQAGLRLESVRTNLHQRTLGRRYDTRYFDVYPSLHLSYRLDDLRQLTASYSERVQRPPPALLNPFPIYANPKTLQQGDPTLQAIDTRSVEVGYEMRQGQTYHLATLYRRQIDGDFGSVVQDLGNGVFQYTYRAFGESRTTGLELVANRRLTSQLTYSASVNAQWRELDTANLGVGGKRSAFTMSGRANFDYQASPDDLVQINLVATGKRLVAQGYTEPTWTVNFGWRHKFNDRVTAVLSVQDLFATSRARRIFETPTLRGSVTNEAVTRAVLLRLDYRFGGPGPRRETGFEYGAGAPATP
ncbi:outer membrane beta-barrel family protein [Phenylobacterium sp.]|uniref:outer membrane beta-barrel family protein n=1 Tax=Phenylobacterium sp. TaxID=1871053 RepID=UPI002FCA8900